MSIFGTLYNYLVAPVVNLIYNTYRYVVPEPLPLPPPVYEPEVIPQPSIPNPPPLPPLIRPINNRPNRRRLKIASTRDDFGSRTLVYPSMPKYGGTKAVIKLTESNFDSGVTQIRSQWAFINYRLQIASAQVYRYKGYVDLRFYEPEFRNKHTGRWESDVVELIAPIVDIPKYNEINNGISLKSDELEVPWYNREQKIAYYSTQDPQYLHQLYSQMVHADIDDITNYNLVMSFSVIASLETKQVTNHLELEDERYYLTITPESIKRAKKKGDNTEEEAILNMVSEVWVGNGSDLEVFSGSFTHNLVFFFQKRRADIKPTRKGAFLPYILDLTKPEASKYVDVCKSLQIYNTNDELVVPSSCCLEYAINVGLAKVGEPPIKIDRRYIEQGSVRSIYLSRICKDLDICIALRRCREVNNIRSPSNGVDTRYNPSGKTTINILLVMDHYMYYESSNVTVPGDSKNYTTRTLLVSLIDQGFLRPMTVAELDKCSPKELSTDNSFSVAGTKEDIISDCIVEDLSEESCLSTPELKQKMEEAIERAKHIHDKKQKKEADREAKRLTSSYNRRFPYDREPYYTVFFDTETANFGLKVTPYLMCWSIFACRNIEGTMEYEYKFIKSSYVFSTTPGLYLQDNLMRLKPLGEGDDVNVTLIAHNLGFDMSSLWTTFGAYSSCLGTRSKPKQVTYYKYYKGQKGQHTYKFQDSYQLISHKLADFQKELKLEGDYVNKLEFPYDFVTSERALGMIGCNNIVRYSELEDFYRNKTEESKLQETLENLEHTLTITKSFAEVKDLPFVFKRLAAKGIRFVDMRKMALGYCQSDVAILAAGFQKFEKSLSKSMNLVAEKYFTTASWAYSYVNQHGGLKSCVKIRGELRMYLTNAIYGGRCMTRDNRAWYLSALGDGGWVYFDGVSLYPSAMIRMGGVPKGVPDYITDDYGEMMKYKDLPYYVVTIDVIDVPSNLPFPVLLKKSSSGIEYSNDFRGKIVFGKYDMQVLELFGFKEGVHYKTLFGVYWRELSYGLGDVIDDIFQRRVTLKALKDKTEALLKLAMNSCYGKTIQKFYAVISKYYVYNHENDDDSIDYSDFEDVVNHLSSHYGDDIKLISTIHSGKVDRMDGGGRIYTREETHVQVVSAARAYDTSNKVHVGGAVLGMARLIMAEVFWAIYQIEQEDKKKYVYYTDTDSILVDHSIIDRLGVVYENKFGRKLEGLNVGQFHSDFTPPTDYDDKYIPRSVKSYIIGKKFYSHYVKYKLPSGEFAHYYHNRMKGVPSSLVRTLTSEDYEKFYKGEMREFDLLENGKRVRFKFDPLTNQMNKFDHFSRTVKRIIPTSEETTKEFEELKNKRLEELKNKRLEEKEKKVIFNPNGDKVSGELPEFMKK